MQTQVPDIEQWQKSQQSHDDYLEPIVCMIVILERRETEEDIRVVPIHPCSSEVLSGGVILTELAA